VKSRSILFFYNNYTSFVRTDFEILTSVYQVRKYQFKPVKGLVNTAIELIKQFLFLSVHIWKYDAVYIWFADYHSLLPVFFAKIFTKKSFLVIGGYEVCRIKNLNYGALCSKLRGFFCIRSMYLSTLNLTVSSYINRKVKFIAPGSKTQLVYNCVDLEKFSNKNNEKENLVLTVGIIENERSFFLKGIDTFIEVARRTPAYQFIIIGLNENKLSALISNSPGNLKVVGIVTHNELPVYYSRAKFYCQFSRSESFGVSVAEAMFYGCIPIVTNEGGMPEIIGDTGYIVSRNTEQISQLLIKMPNEKSDLQIAAHRRIIANFSLHTRKEILITRISNILTQNT
jgi:glycosyltransferase involved in cell wall biosynthesis